MTTPRMKRIYLVESTLDEIFYDRNLAEVIEYLKNLTDSVSLNEVQVCHETYYDEADKISIWYERPETEEEKQHREAMEADQNKRRTDIYLDEYRRSRQFLIKAGLIDPSTGSLRL